MLATSALQDASTSIALPFHPSYSASEVEMTKWRYTFEGGETFRDRYLRAVLPKESLADFYKRREMTPIPGFAAEGILKIRDSLFQHFPQIRRQGGPKSYRDAIEGVSLGVDLSGNSMDTFIGSYVLLELLLMGKVGVFVDMPKLMGPTRADNLNRRPYLYYYPRENIINWVPDTDPNSNEFESVLLKDYTFRHDKYNFPVGDNCIYRRIFKDKATGDIYEQKWHDKVGFDHEEVTRLGISRVPFVLLEISDSLMRRVCDHQIALMNIDSLDYNFLMKANFPFYIEEASQQGQDAETITAGPSKGRRYPKGSSNPPAYINPSSEPMKASLDKQEQLKVDIRRLLDLSVKMIKQTTGSNSKGTINPQVQDSSNDSMQTGMSNIGLTLETGEQKISSFWSEYEDDAKPAVVLYPRTYNTKSDSVRVEEAAKLAKLIDKTPSKTYQRAVAKEVAQTLLGGKTSSDVMDKITKEIEEAEIIQTDCETISMDVQGGLVAPDDASQARGYPKGSVKKAQEWQAQRAAAIVVAQTAGAGHAANAKPGLNNPAARGAPDLDPTSDRHGGQMEKKDAKTKGPKNPNPGGSQADKAKKG